MSNEALEKIKKDISENNIILYMKGSKGLPNCGFSSTVVKILDILGADYITIDVLADEEIRKNIKIYSNWPTIPQLYIKGEFIGGCDIVKAMYQAGELQALVENKSDNIIN